MDKIKDFFHYFSDIIFAIFIASIMFLVLTFNLGSWYNDSSNTVLADNTTNTQENQNNNINNKPSKNMNIENKNNELETEDNINKTGVESVQNNNEIDSSIDENEEENKINEVIQETKKIFIPNGTFGARIATILKENELIDNPQDFVQAAENLNLVNRLKSGSFEIPASASVEDMVKIIAGQKNM